MSKLADEEAQLESEENQPLGTTTVVDIPASGAPGVPATQTVPEVWPVVPVIAINKHPVFPKFIKIVEISDERMMAILRRKVRLNQPYAGVFVKRDDDNLAEVVKSPEELYPVGSFVQIIEMQDLGSRLRMVVMSHRRISLQGQVHEEPTADLESSAPSTAPHPSIMTPPTSPTSTGFGGSSGPGSKETTPDLSEQSLLIVETENVGHEPFETTDEVKALTQEIIKTIRDIIVSSLSLAF